MLMLLSGLLLAGVPEAKQFTANLLLTNQPGTLFMRWQQGQRVDLANVQTARRGEPIAAVVLFSACGRDAQGKCEVRMDMAVLDPGGKVYGESKDTEVWVGKAAPSAGATQLSVGYLMIRIEPKDPPGKYQVKARVSDNVSGVVLTLERTFEVAPLRPGDAAEWPADRPKPNLSGFWKHHCEDGYGLKIEPAGRDFYSVSFCGPGGCFEPGTYRPNSPIFSDQSYRVIDGNTLEVLGGDGFSTYYRCPAPAAK
jgi:hypothetical protein